MWVYTMFLLTVWLTVCISQATSASHGGLTFQCRDGWTYYEGVCYMAYSIPMTWDEAVATCQRQGGELFDPLIQEVVYYLRNEMEGLPNTFWTRIRRNYFHLYPFEAIQTITPWADYEPRFYWDPCIAMTVPEGYANKMCYMLDNVVCEYNACLSGFVPCALGSKCINETRSLCNGVYECEDRSDERDCGTACKNYKLIPDDMTSGGFSTSTISRVSDCWWTLEAPVGKLIRLFVPDMYLERSISYLHILTGSPSVKDSRSVEDITGTIVSHYVYSDNNFLHVRLYSSLYTKSITFTWQTVSDMRAEENVLEATNEYQSLKFPFSREPFGPQGMTVYWRITAPEGELITYNVELTEHVAGGLSSPHIYRIRETNGKAVRIFPNEYHTSRSNTLMISMIHSDIIRYYTFKYIMGCNVTISSLKGYITSPGYYSYYEVDRPHELSCEWTLNGGQTKSPPADLTLSIKVELADDPRAGYNANSTMDTIQIFVAGHAVGNIQSGWHFVYVDGIAKIKFKSDATVPSGRFRVSFGANCTPFKRPIIYNNAPYYGNHADISCPTGYQFNLEKYKDENSVNAYCSDEGYVLYDGSRVIPECQVVRCGTPPKINNGYIVNATNTSYRGTATYGCDSGFGIEGDSEVTCSENGEWKTPPLCTSSQCRDTGGILDVINGGYIIEAGNNFTDRFAELNVVLKFYCDDGYELIGQQRTQCTTDGWKHLSPPTCRKLRCVLPEVPNAQPWASVTIEYEGRATFICKQGYAPTGVQIVSCLANKTLDKELSCTNIDECRAEVNPCDITNETCQDRDPGFECLCNNGCVEDVNCQGKTCENNIDDCVDDTCTNGTCVDGVDAYTCDCNPGYTGTMCETDIDECSSVPCQHNGVCTDLVNDYICSCEEGWTGKSCQLGADKCDANTCQHDGQCFTIAETPICRCQGGTQGDACESALDICDLLSGADLCQNNALCQNQEGTAVCICEMDYTGAVCEFVKDWCSNETICQNGGTCRAISPKGYTCDCREGYDGIHCENAPDPCESSPCGVETTSGAKCISTVTEYYCQCPNGRPFNGYFCINTYEVNLLVDNLDGGMQTGLNSPFRLESNSVSIMMRVRIDGYTYWVGNEIFELFSFQEANPMKRSFTMGLKREGSGVNVWVETEAVWASLLVETDVFDGMWHHIGVAIDEDGILSSTIDAKKKKDSIHIGQSLKFNDNMWLKLGGNMIAEYKDVTVWKQYFSPDDFGKAYAYTLTTGDPVQGWWNYKLPSSTALLRSDIKTVPVLENSMMPPVLNCSGTESPVEYVLADGFVSRDNIDDLTMNLETIARNNPGLDIQTNLPSELSWGWKAGIVIGQNDHGYGECRFPVYIKYNDKCPAPVKLSEDVMYSTCINGDGVCSVFCSSAFEGVSASLPRYMPCSGLGVYDIHAPYNDLYLPACNARTFPKYVITARMQFQFQIQCNLLGDALATEVTQLIKDIFIDLNTNKWTDICDPGCSNIQVQSARCSSDGNTPDRFDLEFKVQLAKNFLTYIHGVRVGAEDAIRMIIKLDHDVSLKNIGTGQLLGDSVEIVWSEECTTPGSIMVLESSVDDLSVVKLCVPCGPGSYYSEPGTGSSGQGECVPCPKGQYQDELGKMECKPCGNDPTSGLPMTTYRMYATSVDQCKESCPAGQYRHLPDQVCLNCPYNTYQDQAGQSVCTYCAKGLITLVSGSTSSTDCIIGNCSIGTYANVTSGILACVPCAVGTYSDRIGQGMCTLCEPTTTTLKYASDSNADCVDKCTVGNGYVESSGSCSPCPQGQYNDLTGAEPNKCKVCPAGKTNLKSESRDCTINDPSPPVSSGFIATIVNMKYQVDIDNCNTAIGLVVIEIANTVKGHFNEVQRNEFSQSTICVGSTCDNIRVNLVQDSCTALRRKRAVDHELTVTVKFLNVSAILVDDIGRLYRFEDILSRILTTDGKELSILANDILLESFDNLMTKPVCIADEKINNTVCERCPAGTYEANGICNFCAPNTYQDLTGQTSCKSCPEKTKYTGQGATSIEVCKQQCPAGTYEANGICNFCGTNTYQDLTGQTFCKSCPEKTEYTGQGATSIEVCEQPSSNETFVLGAAIGGGGAFLIIALLVVYIFISRRRRGLKKTNTKDSKDEVYETIDYTMTSEGDKNLSSAPSSRINSESNDNHGSIILHKSKAYPESGHEKVYSIDTPTTTYVNQPFKEAALYTNQGMRPDSMPSNNGYERPRIAVPAQTSGYSHLEFTSALPDGYIELGDIQVLDSTGDRYQNVRRSQTASSYENTLI